MSRQVSPSNTDKVYGLERVSRLWACHGPSFTDTVIARRGPSAGDPGRRA
jgi:hypothetical protein